MPFRLDRHPGESRTPTAFARAVTENEILAFARTTKFETARI